MNIDEIKEYIKQNENNESVQTLINSLADQRVNQARETWETELPQRIETEIATRQERERLLQEKRENIQAKLGKLFEDEKINLEWCEPFLPTDLADLDEERLKEVAAEVIPQVEKFREALQKERYAGAGVRGSNNVVIDKNAAFARRAREAANKR